MQRKELNDHSDVAFIAGITKINLSTLPICSRRSILAVDNFTKKSLISKTEGKSNSEYFENGYQT